MKKARLYTVLALTTNAAIVIASIVVAIVIVMAWFIPHRNGFLLSSDGFGRCIYSGDFGIVAAAVAADRLLC
jgi:hypothetical protein